uniref:U1-type domain-containing protein n=1 Tax=Accipiter nisus TaxID=211598 RepID=A0A8B9M0M6_9AVES
MKRPLSPDHVFEDGIMNQPAVLRGFEEKGLRNDRQDYQLSKEKKKILFSFCEVCNIQLNSAAQAQVHYNGKSHLKRVKQLNNGKLPTSAAPGTLFASTSTVYFLLGLSRGSMLGNMRNSGLQNLARVEKIC